MDFDRSTLTYNVHNIEYSNVPCKCEANMISFQPDSVNLFLVIGKLDLFFSFFFSFLKIPNHDHNSNRLGPVPNIPRR
jgi:hypothetical protein